MGVKFRPVWFDSLGAKSSCTLVETPDIRILIDPGIAVMHQSFPASREDKVRWFEEGFEAIRKASKKADVIVISHYHYDHFIDFDEELYRGKLIFAKNPNEYINDSQRGRAEKFYRKLYERLCDKEFDELLEEPVEREYGDPMSPLLIASQKNFGDYNERRRNLLKIGESWFYKRAQKWNNYRRIPELKTSKLEVRFPEGKVYEFGGTKIKFTGPLFHGIEFSRVGWVFSTVIEHNSEKLIHSSDLNGPIIEDYAEWIISEKPDVLILDGPMTYMLGYTLNLINFRRALENAIKIVVQSNAKLIIYDHHLPREPKFKERTVDVWKKAKEDVVITTAAEYLGKKPVVLR